MGTAKLSDLQSISIILFSSLAILTVACNLLTIVAIYRSKRDLWSTACVFVFAQAVADILICFAVPFDINLTLDYNEFISKRDNNISQLVPYTDRLCKMIFAPIVWHFFFTSINIVLFTLDRMVAAGYPEAHQNRITKRSVCIACAFGLAISLILTRFVIQTINTSCKQCDRPVDVLARTFTPEHFEIAVLPCYLVNVVLFIIVLTEIPGYRREHTWDKVKTMKMLGILQFLYIIGWLPFLTIIQTYLSNLIPNESIIIAFIISFLSIGFKCLTTPFAYLIGLPNFRTAFKRVICCKKRHNVRYTEAFL